MKDAPPFTAGNAVKVAMLTQNMQAVVKVLFYASCAQCLHIEHEYQAAATAAYVGRNVAALDVLGMFHGSCRVVCSL